MHTGPTHKDPNRCYLKSGEALAHRRRSAGLTAGYPNGIAPPAAGDPWYRASRTVRVTIDPAAGGGAAGGRAATLKMINSSCANPKQLWVAGMQSVTWPSEAEMDKQAGLSPTREFTRQDYMQAARRDLKALRTCDAIYMLDGYEQSPGANWEWAYAKELDLKIYYETPLAPEE